MPIKTLILCIFSCVLLSISTVAAAENWNYSIIVDAGSSGSRLHLFRYQVDTNALPTIEDISVTPNQTKMPLTSANESSLDDLLNAAITTLNAAGIDPKTVPIRIYGTAGMRLLTQDQQREIYRTVYAHITKQYPFSPVIVRTIFGEEEAIYDWLDVNYLKKTFTDSSGTMGIIDVGGASMEIAFEMPSNMKTDGTTALTINGKKYILYSSSILGLGQDEARKAMNKDLAVGSCYPAGYSSSPILTASFDFNFCSILYSNVLNNAFQQKDKPILITDQQQIIPIITDQQKFIAFGSVYYAFKFFTPAPTLSQISQAPNRKMLENSINTICLTSWQALQEKYPDNAYLADECANGIYIDQLLFNKNGLLLQDSQLQITNTINQQPIDWPMGALLFQILTKSSLTAAAN